MSVLPREVRLVDWGPGHMRRVPDLFTVYDIADMALVKPTEALNWVSDWHKGPDGEIVKFPEGVLVGFNEEIRWLSWEVCDWLMENDLWDFTQGGRYQEYAD